MELKKEKFQILKFDDVPRNCLFRFTNRWWQVSKNNPHMGQYDNGHGSVISVNFHKNPFVGITI